MSPWKILNGVAWGLSAFLLLAMLWDFITVERDARASRRKVPLPPPPDADRTGAATNRTPTRNGHDDSPR